MTSEGYSSKFRGLKNVRLLIQSGKTIFCTINLSHKDMWRGECFLKKKIAPQSVCMPWYESSWISLPNLHLSAVLRQKKKALYWFFQLPVWSGFVHQSWFIRKLFYYHQAIYLTTPVNLCRIRLLVMAVLLSWLRLPCSSLSSFALIVHVIHSWLYVFFWTSAAFFNCFLSASAIWSWICLLFNGSLVSNCKFVLLDQIKTAKCFFWIW